MRYFVGFVLVLALVVLPLGVGAQDAEEGATAESSLQESAPSSEPVTEEPALQLKLDDAGVEVVPRPPRTEDGYTLEEMDVRVRRAKIGLGSSGVGVVIGLGVVAAALSANLNWWPSASEHNYPRSIDRAYIAGGTLFIGGSLGMIASGAMLGVRKRKALRLQEAHYGTPRRVQWDLARSRLVF